MLNKDYGYSHVRIQYKIAIEFSRIVYRRIALSEQTNEKVLTIFDKYLSLN
jgi:hypothetical protein